MLQVQSTRLFFRWVVCGRGDSKGRRDQCQPKLSPRALLGYDAGCIYSAKVKPGTQTRCRSVELIAAKRLAGFFLFQMAIEQLTINHRHRALVIHRVILCPLRQ